MTVALPWILAAGLALIARAALSRSAGRIFEERSVIVHAPLARLWESVLRLPDLLLEFGKLQDHAGPMEPASPGGGAPAAGTRYRVEGRWKGVPFWTEFEIVEIRPASRLTLRLAADSRGTERRLRDHRVTLSLEAAAPDTTKMRFRLEARLRGAGLQTRNAFAPATLRALLLDLKLRSFKVAVEKELADSAPDVPRLSGVGDGLLIPSDSRPPEPTL